MIPLIMLIALIISIKSCNDYKNNYNKSINNITAINDTIKILKTKQGEHIYTISLLEGNLKSIKDLNTELYNQISDLLKKSKAKGKVTTGISVNSEIVNKLIDTIWVVDQVDTIINRSFDFTDKYRSLAGEVYLKNNNLGLNITLDKINLNYSILIDDQNKLYMKTDNPYVVINNIDSFTIPKQKNKRFSVGPYIGVSYDFVNSKIVPSIGIGVQYSIFKF